MTIISQVINDPESVYTHQRFKIDGTHDWADEQIVGCISENDGGGNTLWVTWNHDDSLGDGSGFRQIAGQWWYVVALDAFHNESTDPGGLPGLNKDIVTLTEHADVDDDPTPEGMPQTGHQTDATDIGLIACWSNGLRSGES